MFKQSGPQQAHLLKGKKIAKCAKEKTIKKIPLFLLITSLTWSLLLYLTPLSLAPETVKDLDGRANQIDYISLWNGLPLPQRIVYILGDLNCHQNYNRSFVVNGNQMPVCSRDTGIFIGCNIGIASVFRVVTKNGASRAFLGLFIKESKLEKIRHPKRIIALILFIGTLPLIIDGILQLFTNYESSNGIRFFTGLVFGVICSFAATVLITSIARQ